MGRGNSRILLKVKGTKKITCKLKRVGTKELYPHTATIKKFYFVGASKEETIDAPSLTKESAKPLVEFPACQKITAKKRPRICGE